MLSGFTICMEIFGNGLKMTIILHTTKLPMMVQLGSMSHEVVTGYYVGAVLQAAHVT
jgi:hypothetical protein